MLYLDTASLKITIIIYGAPSTRPAEYHTRKPFGIECVYFSVPV